MHALLEGRDTLVVMPTGGRKSAIYQVPALLIDGSTIVVSPLIALQRDQVEGLLETGETDAAAVNSTLGDAERERLLEAFERGDLEYLLVAPEQLSDPEFVGRLARSHPSMFVVDEAHCISSWGHDFRPDYLRLGGVVEALGRPPTLALTATAAPIVREQIVASLGMRDRSWSSRDSTGRTSTSRSRCSPTRAPNSTQSSRPRSRGNLQASCTSQPSERRRNSRGDSGRTGSKRSITTAACLVPSGKRHRRHSWTTVSMWWWRRRRSAWESTSRTSASCFMRSRPTPSTPYIKRSGGPGATASRPTRSCSTGHKTWVSGASSPRVTRWPGV